MTLVSLNNKIVRGVADISKEAAYFAPATSPNQSRQTVPAGEVWELQGASVTATTSATVGNRTILLRVRTTSNNILYQTAVASNLAASQANAIRNFTQGGTPALATGILVPAGLIVEAFDSAAIDAVNDVLNLHLMVIKHFTATGV